MIDYIVNSDILTNNAIKNNPDLKIVDKKSSSKNPYSGVTDLTDESTISDNALKLYNQDKEVEKYKNLVMQDLQNGSSSGVNSTASANVVNNGSYFQMMILLILC